MIIRCSSTDRVMACASSLLPTETPYTPNNDEAREGHAVHAAMAVVVAGAEPDVDALCDEYRVERGTLIGLINRGRQAWDQVRQWYPEAVPERPMEAQLGEEVTLRGTSDVASVVREQSAAVLDWKGGWKPSEHPYQLMSYATLAGMLAGRVPHVLGIEVWLRLGTLRIRRWTLDQLAAYGVALVEQAKRKGEQWGPSPTACQYCQRQTNCQARDEYLQSAVTSIAPLGGNRYPVSRELVASLWDKRTELYRALKRFDAIADEMLTEGPIPLDDGRQLELIAEERERLIPAPTIRYLREHIELNADEANTCLSVSKGKLGEVLRARVPRGKGAAAIRQTMADLQQAGAVEKYIHIEKRITAREE